MNYVAIAGAVAVGVALGMFGAMVLVELWWKAKDAVKGKKP